MNERILAAKHMRKFRLYTAAIIVTSLVIAAGLAMILPVFFNI